MRINLSMNPYLFGCGILLAWWLLVFIIVRTRGTARNHHEFWWGSLGCGLLGFTETQTIDIAKGRSKREARAAGRSRAKAAAERSECGKARRDLVSGRR